MGRTDFATKGQPRPLPTTLFPLYKQILIHYSFLNFTISFLSEDAVFRRRTTLYDNCYEIQQQLPYRKNFIPSTSNYRKNKTNIPPLTNSTLTQHLPTASQAIADSRQSSVIMSTVEGPPAAGPSRPPRHRRGRGGYRGRGGATTTTAQPMDASLALRPASVAPGTTSTAPTPTQPSSSNRGSHGRRGGFGRGGRRGGAQLMVNGQRAFGGQLTSSTPAGSSEGSLAADAPEFVPGQPVAPRARPPPVRQAPRPRRMSKSQAPDIATRTHEDITNGQYECVICTNEVLPNSKVWNCKTCWSVLHLSCVKKWSRNEVSTHQQRATENGEIPPPRQWRCPGCNLPKDTLPDVYTCWCQKEIDPRSIPGLPPHSCGQTCSKVRAGKCPHPCELICHAGPCPPCGHMGPSLACFCGKEASSRRCVDTNYDGGWSCGQICGDVLPCGEHTCQRSCHEGLCGSCEVMIDSRCFCGRVEKSLPCSEREDERQSQLDDDTWMGSFDCGAECRRPFDCGNPKHFCESTCHVQDPEPAHCPFSPDVVTNCPCGKTPIDILLSEPRKDCSALIPHCRQKCEKLLPCGHLCQEICHDGECRPCLERIEISCRCGRTTSKTVCHQGTEEPPSCARVCRSTLNCGRHECGERCCPGEKKASERQAAKRKHRALDSAPVTENIEAEHICLKVCGRPLKCGTHSCQDLCHKGPCRSCLEAVFEEISCACGRTVLQPPQPCGTRPPPCHFDCTRRQTCGHPQVKHQCHEDAESCPKCPFLVEKPCICGKKTLKNQPCWFTEVRCGLPCGKKLKCGIHFCQKLCHRQGQCEDVTSPCAQPCGRKKTVCEHDCSDPCHAPYPCKEITPCQAKTFITCECQNQKQPIKCLASKSSPGNSTKTLDCNDECLKLQRNAKLAAALNIDPATHIDDHIPYSQTTLSFYTEYTKFAQQQEREFRVFAADASEKRLRFKPMQAHQRAFIHALAEDFGLDSESQDPEPHRHVMVFKTPRFVSSPMKTLAQCVKLRPVVIDTPAPANTPLVNNAEPFNAFLITNPRFGLTIDEVRADFAPEFAAAGLEFDISFLPSGDVVLRALSSSSGSWLQKLDSVLLSLKPAVSRKVSSLTLASSTSLCAVDGNLNVVRREDESAGSGGWSQVAKGGSGVNKRVVDMGVGGRSSFTVLGSKKEKGIEKKKVNVEDAVEDWEKEVEGWGDA
jgi:transcriptional repressor NF-X1